MSQFVKVAKVSGLFQVFIHLILANTLLSSERVTNHSYYIKLFWNYLILGKDSYYYQIVLKYFRIL